jgi:hypothetical protein
VARHRLTLVPLLLFALAACQPAAPPEPTIVPTAVVTKLPVATATITAEPAAALVIEDDADPPTATPLPKATFYFFWERG